MSVYWVRQFPFDQVNHIAKSRNPSKAVQLHVNIAINLGIGNSTGLGMAPFIVNHPILLHKWIFAREEALRQIRSIEKVSFSDFEIFKNCLHQSKYNIDTWKTESDYQNKKIKSLKTDLEKFDDDLKNVLNNEIVRNQLITDGEKSSKEYLAYQNNGSKKLIRFLEELEVNQSC